MENIIWPEGHMLLCKEDLRIILLFISPGVAKDLEVLMGKFKELTEFQQRFAFQLKIPVGYSKESSTNR